MRAPWTTELLQQLRRRDADDPQPPATGRPDGAEAYAPPQTAEADEPETWLEMRRQFASWG